MARDRGKSPWLDPNKEGQGGGRQAKRYCGRCGNSVQKFRILRGLNLCELCVRELEHRRDGISSCRACGKMVPKELKEHGGYCNECVCPACGKPDPESIRRTGLCRNCSKGITGLCRQCGKEAEAQVRKNKGYCNQCAAERAGKNRR